MGLWFHLCFFHLRSHTELKLGKDCFFSELISLRLNTGVKKMGLLPSSLIPIPLPQPSSFSHMLIKYAILREKDSFIWGLCLFQCSQKPKAYCLSFNHNCEARKKILTALGYHVHTINVQVSGFYYIRKAVQSSSPSNYRTFLSLSKKSMPVSSHSTFSLIPGPENHTF